MVGTNNQLRYQTNENKLDSHDEKENGEEKQGIAMGFHGKNELLVKGDGAQERSQ
jgi:hypothetical protein